MFLEGCDLDGPVLRDITLPLAGCGALGWGVGGADSLVALAVGIQDHGAKFAGGGPSKDLRGLLAFGIPLTQQPSPYIGRHGACAEGRGGPPLPLRGGPLRCWGLPVETG